MKLNKFEKCLIVITVIIVIFSLVVSEVRSKKSGIYVSTDGTYLEDSEDDIPGEASFFSALDAIFSGSDKDEDDGKININKATKAELMTLPEIGDVLAERIIEHREIYGSFASIDEIMSVYGMGENTFDAIKNYIKT
jgi:competence ComEA-like helix-hairpin-helix protein